MWRIPLILSLAACAQGPHVVASVEYPAAVPVRTFPAVWIVADEGPAAQELVQGLARHLRDASDLQVRRVPQEDIQALRQRRTLPNASIVMSLDVDFHEATSERLQSRPETVCGPAGCFTRTRTTSFEVPLLRARTRLSVQDGPSGRALQRLVFDTVEEGRGYDRMRGRALRRIAEKLAWLVDPRTERIQLQLLTVDEVPSVTGVLETIRQGNWRAGRLRLEAILSSLELGALPPETRARLLYNLGMARRFDPVTLEGDAERHFALAAEPLRRAIRLHPLQRYADALRSLERHREQVALVKAQREASAHNRQLRGPPPPAAGALPTPPPGYE